MKKMLSTIVLVSIVFFAKKYFDRQNDGFSFEKIQTTLANSPEWDLPLIQDEYKEIFKQPFYYLGRGLQFYAFESSDGRFVLKFMRHQRLEPHPIFQWLPACIAESQITQCQKRVGYIFRSLKLAMLQVPEKTGLLYVQLNKNSSKLGSVTIFDKVGTRYEVSLDETEFVLQKKAKLIKPTITSLMQEGNIEEAKSRIEQIFALLVECAKMGVCDTDGALIRKNNLGFLPDRAIYVDMGKLAKKESIKTKERLIQDLQRLDPLKAWLSQNYPELADHFELTKKQVIKYF